MKILLVDDDSSCISALTTLLEYNNTLSVAMNGIEAFDMYKTEHFDVVVTDIKMPKMNGIDLLKNIREINSDTHVIIITGHSNDGNKSMARQLGVDGFFMKPLDVRSFMDTLTKIEAMNG